MGKITAVLTLLMVLILSGCGPRFNVEMDPNSDPLRPTFRISESFHASAHVHYVDVFKMKNTKARDATMWEYVWSIKGRGFGEGSNISELKYGVVPKDFTEYHKAEDLKPGILYIIKPRLSHFETSLPFMIDEVNGKLTIRSLSEKEFDNIISK